MPDNNYGSGSLAVGEYFYSPYRALVQFVLSIPPGSTIDSAYLKLYYFGIYYLDPVGRTYWTYQVIHSWTEYGVTWNEYDKFASEPNDWATPGGDYTTTGGASATVPSSYGWMTWTVTDIVRAWVEDGEPNYGFLIKDGDETGDYYVSCFWFREYIPLRPILEVTYTPPTVPPGPGVPEFSLPLVAVVSTAAIILFLYKRKLSPNLPH